MEPNRYPFGIHHGIKRKTHTNLAPKLLPPSCLPVCHTIVGFLPRYQGPTLPKDATHQGTKGCDAQHATQPYLGVTKHLKE